ncbi:RNA helicase [Candidatus Kaiserbacteria bacterium]|nr:MAG: RNA helicase [Candidatus Kaiserbacteria bacterium]
MNTSTQRGRHRSSNSSYGGGKFNRSKSSRGGGFRGGGGNRRGRGARKMPTFDPTQFINTNPVQPETKEEVYVAKNTFKTFGFTPKLAETVASLGMDTPSPIQDQIIPEIMNGNDVVGLAETGTGKTAAFLLPLIEKTLKDNNRQTLILTPTRELAIQIENEFKKLASGFRLFSVTCVGGVNIHPQIKALRRTNHFVIGTPGRVLDLINRKDFKAQYVTTVILDEADRMLDMGFIGDIKKIVGATPKERETHFFSATMDDKSKTLVHDFLKNPVSISVKKKDITNSIEQGVVPFKEDTKFETLLEMLQKPEFRRIIIFGAMKHSVKRLAEQLEQNGIKAESLHGNKSHSQRQRSLAKFKSGNARVLVATDVAARGIHVDNVSHVINYDLPNTFEDYVHRIGRTGRAKEKGKALTFVPSRA